MNLNFTKLHWQNRLSNYIVRKGSKFILQSSLSLFLCIFYVTAINAQVTINSVTPSACSGATNTYSAVVSYTLGGAGLTQGELVVTSLGGSTNIIVDTQAAGTYTTTLTGLNADGASHTVNAFFTQVNPPAAGTATYTAPAACVSFTCASGMVAKSETFSNSVPMQITELNNIALPIPKFNTLGGTRVLQKVLISLRNTAKSHVLGEFQAEGVGDFITLAWSVDGYVGIGDAYNSPSINVKAAGTMSEVNGITKKLVPAGFNSSSWAGDVIDNGIASTYKRMDIAGAITTAMKNFIDPHTITEWVTTVTGDPTTDDDFIYLAPYNVSKTKNTVLSSGFTAYEGVGNIDFRVSTESGFTVLGGGGNIQIGQATNASAFLDVTYFFCEAAAPVCTQALDPLTAPVKNLVISGTAPAANPAIGFSVGSSILGGEVDLTLQRTVAGGTSNLSYNDFPANTFSMSNTSGVYSIGTVTYDGVDGSTTLNPTGLGGLDLSGNTSGFSFDYNVDGSGTGFQTVKVTFKVYTDASNYSTQTQTFTDVTGPTAFINKVFPRAGFTTTAGTGVDWANVGAIEITYDLTTSSATDIIIKNLTMPCLQVCLGSTVFNDVNNNGRQDAGEAGIDGASVQLYKFNGTAFVAEGAPIVTSGGTGNYLFCGLAPGDYKVGVTPPSTFPLSSTDIASTTSPNNDIDGDDNGIQSAVGGEALSNTITLTAAGETAVENAVGTGGAQDDTNENNGNMSLDFGFLINTLPIDLIIFNATKFDESIILNWKTANEKGFSHFDVQKSNDAKEFGTIATVFAANASNYNQTDMSPAIGANYYRLKMVDLDGTFKYSKTISSNFEKDGSFISVENPSNNGEFIVTTNITNPKFSVFNSYGQQINIASDVAGNNLYKLKASNSITGIYFLKIFSEGKVVTKKVLIN